jgi:sulfite reductase (NADPH) flavoprotein alpha-component
MDGVDVLDFLREHPEVVFGAEEFVATLRKLQPRLYSIASSPRVTPETIHLTVAAVRYRLRGRARKGVASTFLADRLEVGETIPVFLHSAKGFRMPEDPSAPMIMVGPGTGVAPFRAFLQDREASGAPGKSWLFFGDQRRATDFLYGDEFEKMAASGLLARLDTAFSRDQEEKVYVQHRMLEHGAELWKWIAEEGAYFYVCGDAKRMAKDVDAALKRIAIERGGLSEEEATEFLDGMKRAKRYRRDVY